MGERTIDYDKNSEFAGHQKNRGVGLVEAAEDIFKCVKEEGMQLVIGGDFMEFSSLSELTKQLVKGDDDGARIWICDENIGG